MSEIRLKEMSDLEFAQFLDQAVLNHSKSLMRSANLSQADALKCSHRQFQDQLPQGRATRDHYFYKIVRNEKKYFGHVWYKRHDPDTALICDLLFTETFRRNAYGQQTLRLVEMDALSKGFCQILLPTVHLNLAAVSLYEVSGYKTILIPKGGAYMIKTIG